MSMLKEKNILLLVCANFFASVAMGITSIGVAWIIVDRAGGEKLLGSATIFITLIIFLSAPYVGVIVDKFSRKNIYLANQLIGAVIVLPIGIYGLMSDHYQTWQLLMLYFSSFIYYAVHYPNLLAFVQEIFPENHLNKLNGLLEIESQSSSVVAGGAAGILFGVFDYAFLFLVVGFAFFISLLLVWLIPYQWKARENTGKKNVAAEIKEGFSFIEKNKRLALLIFSLLIPFLMVMVGNYLRPVYINSMLSDNPSVYGYSSMVYAIGAVFAGIIIPLMHGKWGAYGAVILSLSLFAGSLFFISVLPYISLFLLLQIFQGFGNSGARISRKNIMVEHVPNHLIGRVNSFFELFGTGVRLLLLVLFTATLEYIPPAAALFITSIIALKALLLAFRYKSLLSKNPFLLKGNEQAAK